MTRVASIVSDIGLELAGHVNLCLRKLEETRRLAKTRLSRIQAQLNSEKDSGLRHRISQMITEEERRIRMISELAISIHSESEKCCSLADKLGSARQGTVGIAVSFLRSKISELDTYWHMPSVNDRNPEGFNHRDHSPSFDFPILGGSGNREPIPFNLGGSLTTVINPSEQDIYRRGGFGTPSLGFGPAELSGLSIPPTGVSSIRPAVFSTPQLCLRTESFAMNTVAAFGFVSPPMLTFATPPIPNFSSPTMPGMADMKFLPPSNFSTSTPVPGSASTYAEPFAPSGLSTAGANQAHWLGVHAQEPLNFRSGCGSMPPTPMASVGFSAALPQLGT